MPVSASTTHQRSERRHGQARAVRHRPRLGARGHGFQPLGTFVVSAQCCQARLARHRSTLIRQAEREEGDRSGRRACRRRCSRWTAARRGWSPSRPPTPDTPRSWSASPAHQAADEDRRRRAQIGRYMPTANGSDGTPASSSATAISTPMTTSPHWSLPPRMPSMIEREQLRLRGRRTASATVVAVVHHLRLAG